MSRTVVRSRFELTVVGRMIRVRGFQPSSLRARSVHSRKAPRVNLQGQPSQTKRWKWYDIWRQLATGRLATVDRFPNQRHKRSRRDIGGALSLLRPVGWSPMRSQGALGADSLRLRLGSAIPTFTGAPLDPKPPEGKWPRMTPLARMTQSTAPQGRRRPVTGSGRFEATLPCIRVDIESKYQ